MSFTEDDYRSMIYNLRVNDLQELLKTFCFNIKGKKSELKKQALEILINKPLGLNHQAYLAQIVNIYSFKLGINNPNELYDMMQNRRKLMMSIITQQAQPSRLYQQPSQVSEQSIHIQRAGLPQEHEDHLTHDMNNVNSFIPSTQSLTHVKLKKLPFYEVVGEVLKPSTLVGNERCSLPIFSKGMREEVFILTLSPEYASYVSMHRDISDGESECVYQIQIRICLLEPGSTEIDDYLPLKLCIRINNKICPILSSNNPYTRSQIEARRTTQPINCTNLFKSSPSVANVITVNWTPDKNIYVMGMYVIKKFSSEELFQKLINKVPRSSEETKSCIIKKWAEVDPDLITTTFKFSLVCPLGQMRMKNPAKSIHCKHLQCFDASTFILMNEKKPTWTCPTCNKPCLYDDIQIDSYFSKVVSSPSLPYYCDDIELLADGTWKLYDKNKVPDEIATDVEEKLLDFINLDDSDDENFMEVKKKHKPERSKGSENFKSGFIDLTLSNDEEPPIKKKKT